MRPVAFISAAQYYKVMVRRKKRWSKDTINETLTLLLLLVIVGGALIYRAIVYIHTQSLWHIIAWVIACVVALGMAYGAYQWYRVVRRVMYRTEMFQAFHHAGIDRLHHMNPFDFQNRIGFHYETQGYTVYPQPQHKDAGIDFILRKERKQYVVQVKRYAPHHAVTAPEVREFYGSFAGEGYERGIFITLSGFTADAKIWARSRALTLIDGNTLIGMLYLTKKPSWHAALTSRVLRVPLVRWRKATTYQLQTTSRMPAEYERFWPNSGRAE